MIKRWWFNNCLIAFAAIVVLAGCGIATSDEERLARAADQMADGEFRAAIIELKNVLGGDPNNVDARVMLAKVSLGLGDALAAEKEVARAADLGAPESVIRPLHYRILLAQGDYAGVLSGLGMDAGGLTDSDVLEFRGQALIGLGNYDEAEATFRESLASDPASVDAAVGLANALIGKGEYQPAVELMEELVAGSPQAATAWQALGIARGRSGDPQGAEAALNQAAETMQRETDVRRYASILALLTEVQLTLEKKDDARRNLNRLAGIFPEAPGTMLLAARLARMDQDYAQAARHLQVLLNQDPDNSQAQLLLANMQMMLGNYAQAESLLGRVVAKTPENVQARKLLAQVQLRRSQPAGAIEALSPILDVASDDREIYELLAQINLQEGDAQAAVENFRAIVAKAPDDAAAKLNLAAAYLNVGDPAQALEVLDIIPDDAGDAFRKDALRMTALVQAGNPDEATSIARQMLDAHADSSVAVGIVANYFASIGDIDTAASVLEDRLASAPDDVPVLLALARVALQKEDLGKAESLFRKAGSVDDGNLTALLGLARIAELGGRDEEVDELLQKGIEQHPRDLRPKVWLASRYLAGGQVFLAEKLADEVVAIGFQGARVSQIVGRVYVAAGRLDDALTQFTNGVRLSPDLPTLQWDLARTYLALERTVDARAALQKALELDPDWLPAKATLTLVELRQGDVDDAMRHLDELKASYPDNASVQVLEGEVFLYQKDFGKAADAFARAVEKGAGSLAMLKEFQSRVNGKLEDADRPMIAWLDGHPEDLGIRALLAEYYEKSLAPDKAIGQYEQILARDSENVPALNNLAWHYQQAGRLEEALALAEDARRLDPESGSIADTLAWIHRDLGNRDQSLELLTEAVQLSPENGEIQYHYALALSDAGQKDQSRQVLERLIASQLDFPSRQQAEQLLGQL